MRKNVQPNTFLMHKCEVNEKLGFFKILFSKDFDQSLNFDHTL